MSVGRDLRRVTYLFYGLIFTSSLIGAQVSGAATYYVATTGSDTNNSCSEAQNQATPKRTINGGLNCLSGGDTLIIKAGTYAEYIAGSAIPSGTASAHTVVKAETPGTVTIKPTTSTSGGPHLIFLNETRSYITLDGLTISGANLPAGISRTALKIQGVNGSERGAHDIIVQRVTASDMADGGSCIQVGGYNHRFTDVRVFNCLDTGSIGAHGFYFQARDSLVDRAHISNTTSTCIQFYHTSSGQPPKNNIMRNSICRDSGGRGIYAGGSGHRIYNNIVYNTGGVTGDGGIRTEGNNILVRNNIIVGSNSRMVNNGTGNTYSHNLCHRFSSSLCALNADPLFVDARAANFRLQTTSPAIDKGINLSDVPTDAGGITRPQGSTYDIGAYELKQGPLPDIPWPTNLRITSAQ